VHLHRQENGICGVIQMFGKAETAMSESQRQKWGRTRERGLIVFCTERALILGGSAFLYHVFHGVMIQDHPMTGVLMSALESVLAGCTLGVFEGVWQWNSNEKRKARTQMELGLPDESISSRPEKLQRGTLNGEEY
jgi:hypothetical protein